MQKIGQTTAMQPTDVEVMRRLSKEYQENPIESVQCVVMATRDEAQHWMELRHAPGRHPGASIVSWTSDDASRFRSRAGKVEFHTQVLNLLESGGHLSATKRRNVPAASFKRLLGTPEVRAKLGIESEEGVLTLTGEEKRVIKALMHVVSDLESGRTKTKDIYTKPERIAYANGLPASVMITRGTAGKKITSTVASKPKIPVRGSIQPPLRDKLIPTKCVLNITEPRLHNIARELRKDLSLTQHTNAVSVLFRVFLELSADAYMNRENIPIDFKDKLSDKLKKVSDELIRLKKLTRDQANPVRLICHRDSFLAPSTALMNEYVHNLNLFPAPTDLRAYWDNIEPFMTAVWAP